MNNLLYSSHFEFLTLFTLQIVTVGKGMCSMGISTGLNTVIIGVLI